MNFGKRGVGILMGTLAAALAAALAMTVVARRAHLDRETEHAFARVGLEDVTRRVEQVTRNLAAVRAMNDAVVLAQARALAQLIAENPDVLKPENRGKFESYAETLAVDELHVTDGKGVFVRSYPAAYEGTDLYGSESDKAFLPALTNAAFELVQTPQQSGLSAGSETRASLHYQYAGVPRRDAPGLVRVGHLSSRLAEAEKLADVSGIAATARLGRDGHVTIEKSAKGRAAVNGMRTIRDRKGRVFTVFEAEAAGYRIVASLPDRAGVLARDGAFEFLFVLDLILLALLMLAMPTVRRLMAQNFRDLMIRLGAGHYRRTTLWRQLTGPLAVTSVLVFASVLAILSVIAHRTARRAAEDRLKAAAADVVEALDCCVDDQLAFVSEEICRKYETPAAMKGHDMHALMRTYFLDEINVIDETGHIVATSVDPILGDNQWTKRNPAKFCQALLNENKAVYSQPFRESADEPGVFRKYVGTPFPPPAKGYIQVGFERSRLYGTIDYTLGGMVHDWHIGETGFYVIARTENGEIISAGRAGLDGRTFGEVGFDAYAAQMRKNVDVRDPGSREFRGFGSVSFFEASFDGERCLCTSGVVDRFHRYVAAIPLEEVYGSSRRLVWAVAAVMLVVLVLVVFFLTRLSDLVTSLREKEREERERMEKDLTLARTIQTSSLAAVFPESPDWGVRARMDTAREVGGDFYDSYVLPTGRLCVLIADVSGKGVPAALFMMRAKTTLRAAVFGHPDDLAAAVVEANDALAEKNEAEMFVTAWIGVYDAATHTMEYVNAGHNPPIVKHVDGTASWVRNRSGLVLAAMGGVSYRVQRLALVPDDRLLLYTDGVTEAMNVAHEQYGEPRLEAVIRQPGLDLVAAVRADLTAFVGAAEPSDDITMVELEIKA